MGFYRSLAAARRAPRTRLRILALSHESRETLEDYLKAHGAHGLAADGMISLAQDEYRRLKVRGTPTLILADRSGLIRRVWAGRLRPELENVVLADLLAESQ
jgi:hypothetical protein